MNRDLDLDLVDERLRAWARYFKDRHIYSRAKSIEGRFNPFSKGAWDEGWGNQDEIPPAPIPPRLDLASVLETHTAIHELDKAGRWAITYGFCYPNLDRWLVLKLMRKYTGKRFTWKQYLAALDAGRFRVYVRLFST